MRALLLLCLIAAVAAQYDYSPVQEEPIAVGGGGGGGGGAGGAPVGAAQLSQPIVQPQNEFNKEFYSYTAPDHEFEDAGAGDHVANTIKKNLRVVFIKGPDNSGLENAALQLAKSATDDRTAIYVLSKQADVSDLASQLQATRNNANNKPEVHFVKYRTQADAENAQRVIQSQYDSLPGPATNHNAGTAPVLDFASKPSSGYSSPSSSYLPPGRRF